MPETTNTQLTTSQTVSPSAYRLDTVDLETHVIQAGERKIFDIKNFVTDFTITESIYSLSLQLSMNIKENTNLLEFAKLTGQEKIRVRLARTAVGSKDEENIDLTFIVTEYPVFGRFDSHTQVYSIRGISEFAFVGKLKSISKSIKGPVTELIQKILVEDLNVNVEDIFLSESKSDLIKAVIPYMSPVDAVNWLLRRAFDDNDKPFYCYQTFSGQIRIESQSDFAEKENYRTFRDGKFYTNDVQGKDDYQEKLERILSIASDLKMSKFVSSLGGAFGSTTVSLDISNKTVAYDSFNYSNDFKRDGTLNEGKTLSNNFIFEEQKNNLGRYSLARIFYIPTNSSNLDSDKNIGYNSPTQFGSINRVQSAVENLDTITHDMTVFGDFNLNPGKPVEIILPKSIDPGANVSNTQSTVDKGEDLLLSGRYLLSAVVHKFAEQYYCSVRVKTDTLKKDFITS